VCRSLTGMIRPLALLPDMAMAMIAMSRISTAPSFMMNEEEDAVLCAGLECANLTISPISVNQMPHHYDS
jgi:hypothetical protein